LGKKGVRERPHKRKATIRKKSRVEPNGLLLMGKVALEKEECAKPTSPRKVSTGA